jgi:hypothetical protein
VEKRLSVDPESAPLDPLCAESRVEPTRAGKFLETQVSFWIFSCEVDIFADSVPIDRGSRSGTPIKRSR